MLIVYWFQREKFIWRGVDRLSVWCLFSKLRQREAVRTHIVPVIDFVVNFDDDISRRTPLTLAIFLCYFEVLRTSKCILWEVEYVYTTTQSIAVFRLLRHHRLAVHHCLPVL